MTTYSDSFESGFGNWSNDSTNDSGDWTRYTGSTPSTTTGPTAASDGSYYLYLEASANNNSYEAILNFDGTLSGDARISFDYHMYGTATGALRLEAYVSSAWMCIWGEATNQGDQWNSVTELAIPEGATSLRFIAGCAGGATSDIALDAIYVEDGLTLDNSVFSSFNAAIVEDFSGGSTSEWTINDPDIQITNTSTPTSSTGPNSAPVSDTYFCYLESTSYGVENTATLSCNTTLNGNGGHIGFYIHKYGVGIALLVLEASNDNGSTWDIIWASAGAVQTSESAAWTEISAFPYPAETTSLRFRYITFADTSYQDFGLGHIVITEVAESAQSPINLLDGKIRIKTTSSNLLDGLLSVKASASNLLDGKAVVASSGTSLLDGKAVVKSVATNLLDGKAAVRNSTTSLVDGKLTIASLATCLLDGSVRVKNSTSTELDGKIVVDTSGQTINVLDGQVRIKSVATDFLDGLVIIGDSATTSLDGKLIVQNLATVNLDGKVTVKDIATNLLDGKAVIKTSAANLIDGKLDITTAAIGLLDGKAIIKDSSTIQLDGKLSIQTDNITNLLDGKIILRRVAAGKVIITFSSSSPVISFSASTPTITFDTE